MIIGGDRSVTYPEIHARIARAASGFGALGLGGGVEGWMVAQPQVAAEPQDRRGHARISSRRIDRSNSGGR